MSNILCEQTVTEPSHELARVIGLRFVVVVHDVPTRRVRFEYYASLHAAKRRAAAIREACQQDGRWLGGHPVLSEHQWHQRDHVTRQQIRTLRIEQAQPPRGDD